MADQNLNTATTAAVAGVGTETSTGTAEVAVDPEVQCTLSHKAFLLREIRVQ